MLRTRILPAALAALLTIGVTAPVVAAASETENARDIAALKQAKISLTEAIDTAERYIGGTAIEAGLDDESHGNRFEIEVVKDSTIHQVMVDSTTGKVLSAGSGDHSGDNDEHDED